MNPSVQGYTAAVLGGVPSDRLPGVAADLASFHQLLDASSELRASLTDTALSGPVRRAVVADLLAGKVSAEAARIAAYAVGAVSAPEVPLAVDWVASSARHFAEQIGDVEAPMGHLSARRRVGGYATAVFEDLPTPALDEIEDELFRFTRTVESSPALRGALADRDLPVEVRQGVVDQLLASRVQPATLALARYAVAAGRPRDIVGTLDYLVVATATARGWRVARVHAAREVGETERAALSQALTTLAGAPVQLQVSVDPALLSGVLVRLGDMQVDATARGRLEALHEHLLVRAWDEALDMTPNPEHDRDSHDEGAH